MHIKVYHTSDTQSIQKCQNDRITYTQKKGIEHLLLFSKLVVLISLKAALLLNTRRPVNI